MKPTIRTIAILVLTLGLSSAALPSHAEVVEEIIAWVNGEIITRSEFDDEEQARTAEAYRQFTGDELDQQIELMRKELLLSLINRRILLNRAQAMGYDLDRMGDSFMESFMQLQGFDSIAQVQELAERDGMTVDDVKKKLIRLYGPDEVIRYEVSNRISISDGEIEAYYTNEPEPFQVEGEVTFREIVLLADDSASKDTRRPEAEKIWERVTSGEDFSALAEEFSEAGTAADGGKLGPLKKTDLAEVLGYVAFTLPVGGISELMETPYGFHMIKVVSRIDEHVKPIDDVRERIRNFLQARKFRNELDAFLEKARAESEWCVKPKHAELLSIPAPPPCERL